MRHATRVAAAVLVSLVLGACQRAAPPPGNSGPPVTYSQAQLNRPLPEPLPRVVARVHGQEIGLRNLALLVVESIELGKVPPERRNALYREGLDKLIQREGLFQEAQARGVSADPLQVQRSYDQLRGHYPDDAAWQAFLKSR